MGTYYTLGVIKKFTAESTQLFSEKSWEDYLNERIDVSLFNLNFKAEGKVLNGLLNEGIFENNIQDFYSKLFKITGDEHINYYFDSYGEDINKYPESETRIRSVVDGTKRITITFCYAMLFIEGKVLAETFNYEPKLMSWLFRHCDFGNALSGCVISDITG